MSTTDGITSDDPARAIIPAITMTDDAGEGPLKINSDQLTPHGYLRRFRLGEAACTAGDETRQQWHQSKMHLRLVVVDLVARRAALC